MKHLILSAPIIFSACLLFFCECNNSTSTTAVTANLSGNEGSFSYTINGERVKAVAGVQNGGLFINEVSNDAANGMLTIEVTPNGKYFKFHIANSGTTTIGQYQPSLSVDKKSKEATYTDPKILGNLESNSVTVTITGINANRVSGTFSGTFTQDKSYGNQTANITDGSFDLPFMKN